MEWIFDNELTTILYKIPDLDYETNTFQDCNHLFYKKIKVLDYSPFYDKNEFIESLNLIKDNKVKKNIWNEYEIMLNNRTYKMCITCDKEYFNEFYNYFINL